MRTAIVSARATAPDEGRGFDDREADAADNEKGCDDDQS